MPLMAQGARYHDVPWDYSSYPLLEPPEYSPNIIYCPENTRSNTDKFRKLHDRCLSHGKALKCITTASTPNLDVALLLVAGHREKPDRKPLTAAAAPAPAAAAPAAADGSANGRTVPAPPPPPAPSQAAGPQAQQQPLRPPKPGQLLKLKIKFRQGSVGLRTSTPAAATSAPPQEEPPQPPQPPLLPPTRSQSLPVSSDTTFTCAIGAMGTADDTPPHPPPACAAFLAPPTGPTATAGMGQWAKPSCGVGSGGRNGGSAASSIRTGESSSCGPQRPLMLPPAPSAALPPAQLWALPDGHQRVFYAYFLPFNPSRDTRRGEPLNTSWLDRRLREKRCRDKDRDLVAWRADREAAPTCPATGLPLAEANLAFRHYQAAAGGGSRMHVSLVESVLPGRAFFYTLRPWRQRTEGDTTKLEPVMCEQHELFAQQCDCPEENCGKLEARLALRRLRSHGVQVRVCVRQKKLEAGRPDLGVFAAEFIRAGTYLWEYLGELIYPGEVAARTPQYEAAELHYMYDMDHRTALRTKAQQAGELAVVDATHLGNVARFVNHRCEGANCRSVNVCMGGLDDSHMAILVQASVDIPMGEEVTYDYQAGLDEEEKAAIRANPEGKVVCRCGAPSCLGYVFPFREAVNGCFVRRNTAGANRRLIAAASRAGDDDDSAAAAGPSCAQADGGPAHDAAAAAAAAESDGTAAESTPGGATDAAAASGGGGGVTPARMSGAAVRRPVVARKSATVAAFAHRAAVAASATAAAAAASTTLIADAAAGAAGAAEAAAAAAPCSSGSGGSRGRRSVPCGGAGGGADVGVDVAEGGADAVASTRSAKAYVAPDAPTDLRLRTADGAFGGDGAAPGGGGPSLCGNTAKRQRYEHPSAAPPCPGGDVPADTAAAAAAAASPMAAQPQLPTPMQTDSEDEEDDDEDEEVEEEEEESDSVGGGSSGLGSAGHGTAAAAPPRLLARGSPMPVPMGAGAGVGLHSGSGAGAAAAGAAAGLVVGVGLGPEACGAAATPSDPQEMSSEDDWYDAGDV